MKIIPKKDIEMGFSFKLKIINGKSNSIISINIHDAEKVYSRKLLIDLLNKMVFSEGVNSFSEAEIEITPTVYLSVKLIRIK